MARPRPKATLKENTDPNVNLHSVRQHFEKRNTTGSLGSGKNVDCHLKIAKKPIHNTTGTKREVNQLVKEPTFLITQRDIESFILQSKRKAEEFDKTSTTVANDLKMEDSVAPLGAQATNPEQRTPPPPICAD
ncbi:unnamed protein product [Linum trigynum]|uniref:Uncharacterized protein n=1 Tax=Linum trigynum TaxID=586398 RepID=A0AAV2ET51_9ROSI